MHFKQSTACLSYKLTHVHRDHIRAVSGAIHPFIQIGYGVEFGLDALVAEGLVLYAMVECFYDTEMYYSDSRKPAYILLTSHLYSMMAGPTIVQPFHLRKAATTLQLLHLRSLISRLSKALSLPHSADLPKNPSFRLSYNWIPLGPGIHV